MQIIDRRETAGELEQLGKKIAGENPLPQDAAILRSEYKIQMRALKHAEDAGVQNAISEVFKSEERSSQ